MPGSRGKTWRELLIAAVLDGSAIGEAHGVGIIVKTGYQITDPQEGLMAQNHSLN